MSRSPDHSGRTFGEEVAFLHRHMSSAIVLGPDPQGPRLALVGQYQGRVMTSSARGDSGRGAGWINHELIASGARRRHINAYGGEERFWLGPEGGQFGLFFAPGAPFTLEAWQTPAAIDHEPFDLVSADAMRAAFSRDASVQNRSGATFDLRIERSIALLESGAADAALGADLAGVSWVGYESINRLTNTGRAAWRRESGLLSIWILGMFNPGPRVTVVIPFRRGSIDELGPVVNDAYFGSPPPDRLRIGDGEIYFRGDAMHRAKIGVGPRRAVAVAGAWDPDRGRLTIVRCSPSDAPAYVNSMWEHQAEPYAGDVINSYNDGPAMPGGPALGGFYEIETSSPALALAPGESATHISRTFHIEGERGASDAIARSVLGVSLDTIEGALPGPRAV